MNFQASDNNNYICRDMTQLLTNGLHGAAYNSQSERWIRRDSNGRRKRVGEQELKLGAGRGTGGGSGPLLLAWFDVLCIKMALAYLRDKSPCHALLPGRCSLQSHFESVCQWAKLGERNSNIYHERSTRNTTRSGRTTLPDSPTLSLLPRNFDTLFDQPDELKQRRHESPRLFQMGQATSKE
jgi:hypothetical protein